MKRLIRKTTASLLALVLCFALVSNMGITKSFAASKKAVKPGTPVIIGTIASDDNSKTNQIRITISETANASGYYIYLKSPQASGFKKVKTLKKSGEKAREYILDKLDNGNYQVRVMAYHKENNKTAKGSYSNTVNITLGQSDSKTDPAALEYSKEKYPLIKEMADNGLIQLSVGESLYKRDTITLGKYKVDRYNESKDKLVSETQERALEWEVLEYSSDGKSALVISKNIITGKPYSKKAKKYSWKDSDIRKWLNEDFLNAAFTKEEQELIKTVTVTNDDPGGDTLDKLYLLNEHESDLYLKDYALDFKYPIAYTGTLYDGTTWSWFLRERYENKYILGFGDDGELGYSSPYKKHGIRPVFRIELTPKLIKNNSLSCITPAGNITGSYDIYVNLGKYDFPTSEGICDGTEENIEWKILDYDEKTGKALLISRYLFRNELSGINKYGDNETWRYSESREWLRHTLYEEAFTDEEKALMSQITINSYGNTNPKSLSKDKLFLFSYSDAVDFFGSDNEIIGHFIDEHTGEWRLQGENYVDCEGQLNRNYENHPVNYIRPAMYLNLTSGKDSVPEPDAPEYSAKPTVNGSGIEINIEKTYLAEGYHIYMKAPGQKKYKKIKTIAENGSGNMYVVLRNLNAGNYSVYVKAYRTVDGKELLSDNNNLNDITLKGFTGTEYAESTYPELKGLADKGLIGLKINYTKDSIKLGKWALPNFYTSKGENTTESELEWVILEYSDDFKQALVSSKYIVSKMGYNNKDENVTWDRCSLREWLNKDFFDKAFSDEEKSLIKITDVKNEDNPVKNTSGGEDTKDRLFLLSISEAEKYLDDDNWDPFKDGLKGYIDYEDRDVIEWLRSPGRTPANINDYWALDPVDREEEFDDDWMNGYAATYYGREDGVDYTGLAVVEDWCVRPAFRIDLTPELIEANKLSLDKAERGHYTNVLVEFGAYTDQTSRNKEGNDTELVWELAEYDSEHDKALLLCTSKITKEDFENDFLKNSFSTEENSIIEEISAYEEDSEGVRPAIWITLNPAK